MITVNDTEKDVNVVVAYFIALLQYSFHAASSEVY
jgi:hypothetical protein